MDVKRISADIADMLDNYERFSVGDLIDTARALESVMRGQHGPGIVRAVDRAQALVDVLLLALGYEQGPRIDPDVAEYLPLEG